MNSTGDMLTVLLAVAMVLALMRARLELGRSKPGFLGCFSFVTCVLLLVATDVRFNPGGPFFSMHAEIIPVAGCLCVIWFAVRNFRAASLTRRAGMLFLSMSSIGIITLAVAVNLSFWSSPHSRWNLLGW